MIERLFHWAEGAVALDNAILTLMTGAIITAALSCFTRRIKKDLVFQGVSFVIGYAIVVTVFFLLRDKVKDYRLVTIKRTMSTIDVARTNCTNTGTFISDWREGLKLITECPTEVGLYSRTADLLAADHDYESAATLIVYGLDFIQEDHVPLPLCERLQTYYPHLRDRPELSSDCVQIHRF